MKLPLDQLLLTKEELPIGGNMGFYIPIHPKLLDQNIKIDETIAARVFPQAAQEWYTDLQSYAETLEEGKTKTWINEVFLDEEPIVKKDGTTQVVRGWEDDARIDDNGFTSFFCISRNGGGSLYYNQGDGNCSAFISFKPNRRTKFSEEKAKEFSIKINEEFQGAKVHCYAHHNIDSYPGALFLRNWAILYINEAIKQVYSQ